MPAGRAGELFYGPAVSEKTRRSKMWWDPGGELGVCGPRATCKCNTLYSRGPPVCNTCDWWIKSEFSSPFLHLTSVLFSSPTPIPLYPLDSVVVSYLNPREITSALPADDMWIDNETSSLTRWPRSSDLVLISLIWDLDLCAITRIVGGLCKKH